MVFLLWLLGNFVVLYLGLGMSFSLYLYYVYGGEASMVPVFFDTDASVVLCTQ